MFKHRQVGNCYPQGTPGYQPGCLNPGYEFDSALPSHWGNEPYYHSNYRYVWVMDELNPNSTESQHLQAMINAFNSAYVPGGDRPYFLYYQNANFSGWTSCNVRARQWLEVCYAQGSVGSFAQWSFDSVGHFQWAYNAIGSKAADYGDAYLWNSVVHEFGHTLGFAHDTDCTSVMTYCDTFFSQRLGYSTNQSAVFHQLYDVHATN